MQLASKKRAAIVLGVSPNSSTRTLDPLRRLARLMAADPGRFIALFVPYRRGLPLELASWPESRELAGYGHLTWPAYEQAITPIFGKLRRLWCEDAELALETLLPFLREAIP